MTYEMADLKTAYEKGIISSREYVDMAEWLATADEAEDPNEIGLVNLRHALEDGVLSSMEYVYMADFLFVWLHDRLAVPAGETASIDCCALAYETLGGWQVAHWLA